MKNLKTFLIVLIVIVVVSVIGISGTMWIAPNHPKGKDDTVDPKPQKIHKDQVAKQDQKQDDTTKDTVLSNAFVHQFQDNEKAPLTPPLPPVLDPVAPDVVPIPPKPQIPDVPQPAPTPELSFEDQMWVERAKAAGRLYETICRDPDHKETYVRLFQSLLGTKNPHPTIAEQVAIVESYKDLIVYGARAPDVLPFVIQTSQNLFGHIQHFDDPRLQVARAQNGASLYQAIARNFNRKDMLISTFVSLMGEKKDHPTILEQVAIVESYGSLFDSFGNSPTTTPSLIQVAQELFPTVVDLDNPLVRTARAKAGGSLYLSWAKLHPYPQYHEYTEAMIPLFKSLTGEKRDQPTIEEQAAIVKSYGLLFQAYSYLHDSMPKLNVESMQNEWMQMRDDLFPAVDLDLDAVRVVRADTMNDMYLQTARFDNYDTMIPFFKRMLGKKSAQPSQNEQLAIAESYSSLLSAYTRRPDVLDKILQMGNELVGSVDDWSAEPFRIVRANLGSSLYNNVTRQPDLDQNALFHTLTGAKSTQPTIAEQAVIAQNYDMLIQSYLRIPELKDMLLQTSHEQFGELSMKQAPQIQLAKAKVCSAMIYGLTFYSDDPNFHDMEMQALALYHQLFD